MSRAILSSLAFGAALLIGLPALAETVRTKDGQRLVGTIVEETQAELVLRTKYGVLVIPADRIEGAWPRRRAGSRSRGAGRRSS